MELESYKTGWSFPATVVRSARLTPEDLEDIRDIQLEMDEAWLSASPGQSIGVVVPHEDSTEEEEHFRLYSLADIEASATGSALVSISVKRCDYVDEYSGELCHGRASNFLCDLAVGDALAVKGPFGVPFKIPASPDADIILVAAGTGIAPFRAFMKKMYRKEPERPGRVWMFHGAMTGMEQIYHNDATDDFTQYYDEDTFTAFKRLGVRLEEHDPLLLDFALERRAKAIWNMMGDDQTCMYVAGQPKVLAAFNQVFAELAGSDDDWDLFRSDWTDQHRWMELDYGKA